MMARKPGLASWIFSSGPWSVPQSHCKQLCFQADRTKIWQSSGHSKMRQTYCSPVHLNHDVSFGWLGNYYLGTAQCNASFQKTRSGIKTELPCWTLLLSVSGDSFDKTGSKSGPPAKFPCLSPRFRNLRAWQNKGVKGIWCLRVRLWNVWHVYDRTDSILSRPTSSHAGRCFFKTVTVLSLNSDHNMEQLLGWNTSFQQCFDAQDPTRHSDFLPRLLAIEPSKSKREKVHNNDTDVALARHLEKLLPRHLTAQFP